MNKEKLEEYLKKTHIPLSKDFINICIFLGLISNAALYYFFRNIVATIISGILFIVLAIVLFRNRNYLREYDSSLLVKACITGYIFWMFLIFAVLLQLKFKISYLFFILEFIFLVIGFVTIKKSYNKMFREEKYIADYNYYKKSPAKIAGVYLAANSIFLFKPKFIENLAWYVLSALLFVVVFFFCQLFATALFVYIDFLKYYNVE